MTVPDGKRAELAAICTLVTWDRFDPAGTGAYARPMREFLIRTSDDHELPSLYVASLEEMLMPPVFGCTRIEGWGDFRMLCGETEISFSAEAPGWQIGIEGSMADGAVSDLVAALVNNIAAAAGEPCESIQLS